MIVIIPSGGYRITFYWPEHWPEMTATQFIALLPVHTLRIITQRSPWGPYHSFVADFTSPTNDFLIKHGDYISLGQYTDQTLQLFFSLDCDSEGQTETVTCPDGTEKTMTCHQVFSTNMPGYQSQYGYAWDNDNPCPEQVFEPGQMYSQTDWLLALGVVAGLGILYYLTMRRRK